MTRNEELAINVAVWFVFTIVGVGASLLLFAALT